MFASRPGSVCKQAFREARRLKLVSGIGDRLRSRSLGAYSREFATDKENLGDPTFFRENFAIHHIANAENGSKEYVLVTREKTLTDITRDPSIKIASIHRHRNVLFAARTFNIDNQLPMEDICRPLAEIALKEAGEDGEQPQAVASLSGLRNWVKSCIHESSQSEILAVLKRENQFSYDAVHAIATGIPRSGHSVVGVGTYRDGEDGWKALAREYVEKGLSQECNLYEGLNAKLVDIEHMADRSPTYLESAGGAMARLFFL